MESRMTCDIDNEVNKLPWFVDFSSLNDTAPFNEAANSTPDVLSSCTSEDYQQFDSFFTKFMTVAKDHFLQKMLDHLSDVFSPLQVITGSRKIDYLSDYSSDVIKLS